jgi:phosphoribosylanthranilate isomerase
MSVGVKVCGLSSKETLDTAVACGALFVGFVFYARSPRVVTPAQAHRLVHDLPPEVQSVGLFVDPDDATIGEALAHAPLRMIQLHGDETPERCRVIRQQFQRPVMKAIRVASSADVEAASRYVDVVDWLLFDAKVVAADPQLAALPGGNGVSFDWKILAGRQWPIPWMLAGGLNAGNIAEAVKVTGAKSLDVSSGVETGPGIKNSAMIREFLRVAGDLRS